MKKLVYVGFPFKHHKGTHGGYHQIANYVNYDYVVDCSCFMENSSRNPRNLIDRIIRHVVWRITSRPAIPWYLLKCIWIGLRWNDIVFHFIYGENTYCDIKPFIRNGNKIVCTLHQPIEWFRNNHWERKLKSIDEVILVGRSELEKFQKITGKNNVIFIPHGIRTDFYSPDYTKKKERMLLTVGNWLRDYEFANKVYQKLLEQDDELKIVVVAMPKLVECLAKHPRIQCLSGITDEELRNLYRQCSVLFLPLKRYTANNSLLEASACGCNIVIASDYQDNSYMPTNYITLSPMKEDDTVTAIYKTMKDTVNQPLVDYIQHEFSWEKIGDTIEKKYR
ncbi:MAG: glycosyltransferase [Bacteroidales bacterium]|jgi:glycosyltransferase involved in cell wall biosynthesis|nr:glycosyltransferase [Bacteroidales bacterium]